MSSDTAAFSTVLRQLRTAAALSQEALAERAGLSLRGVSDLERGAAPRTASEYRAHARGCACAQPRRSAGPPCRGTTRTLAGDAGCRSRELRPAPTARSPR